MLDKLNPLKKPDSRTLIGRCQNERDMDACLTLRHSKEGYQLGGAQFATTTVGNKGVVGGGMPSFEDGGQVDEEMMMSEEMLEQSLLAQEAPPTDPYLPIMEIIGEPAYQELMQAMSEYPVVEVLADMAMHTGDGEVGGIGGPTDDQVPARLSPGEYVFSAEAVEALSLDKLEELHEYGKQLAASA